MRRLLLVSALGCVAIAAAYAAAPAVPRERVAGDYQLQGVMETGSGLRLSPDGTYRFFLSYGIIDEKDEGPWRIDGAAVVLSSTAPAVPPAFVFVRSARESLPGARVSFEGDGARAAAVLTQGLVISNGREIPLSEKSGDSIQAGGAGAVQRIRMTLMGALREYPVHEHEPVDSTHNHFVFRVTPGNYGYVRFDAVPLRIGEGELYLKTPQMRSEFRYVRVRK
jgi:hypothetical protein